MKTFTYYIREEFESDKQVYSVRKDTRKADVWHYHMSSYNKLSSFNKAIGNGATLCLFGIIIGSFFAYLPEILCGGHQFYNGNMVTTIIGACLFLIGLCVGIKFLWNDLENTRYFRVDNDSTEILYSISPKKMEILPKGTEIKLQKDDINTNGIAEFSYKGKKGFINVNELTDITVYKNR